MVNVSARFVDGKAIMLTIPDTSLSPGKRLVVERIRLEDRLQNGEPMIRYDFVEVRTD